MRPRCPLCHATRTQLFSQTAQRNRKPQHNPTDQHTPTDQVSLAGQRCYFDCANCRLIFLAAEYRLDAASERAHYATHQNDPTDPHYRAFLDRLTRPLLQRLTPGASGLDYGSGPGPTLSVMLEEQGFSVEIWDPFFAPDEAPLQRDYDFITCTEAAEHFYFPDEEFARLSRLLRPGGWLALMTELFRDDRPFHQWYYPRDPTHVCFFRQETMLWLAKRFDWSADFPHPNVVLFRRDG